MLARALRAEFFIAALPPPHIARALLETLAPLRARDPANPEWDWKHPAHYHVTLAIAGEMYADDAGRFVRVLETLRRARFRARFEGVGHFLKASNKRANRHVLWVGFDAQGAAGFSALHENIDMASGVLRLPQSVRALQPHLTVARPANPLRENVRAAVEDAVNEGAAMPRLPVWNVGEVSLIQRLPRKWQDDLGLPHRFHEIARCNLADGHVTQVADVMTACAPSFFPPPQGALPAYASPWPAT